jgi:hypothetical protein
VCGVCGAPPANLDWFSAGVENSVFGRIDAKRQLAAAARAALQEAGLNVTYHPGASTLSLRNSTGAIIVVRQFSEIGPAVRKLGGQDLDPLAPEAIASRARQRDPRD